MLHVLKKHMDQRSSNSAVTPTLLIHEDTSINSVVSYDRVFSSIMQTTHDSPPMSNTMTDQPNSASTATTNEVPAGPLVPHRADDTHDNRSYQEGLVNRNEVDLPTNWGQGIIDQGKVRGCCICSFIEIIWSCSRCNFPLQ
jgi:hypothetical protein